MLLQNQTLLAQYPRRSIGGALSLPRSMWGRAERINIFNGGVDALSAVPNGHRDPSAWVLPEKPGMGSAYSGSGAVSTGTATGAQGMTATGTGAATSSGTATGSAIAPGTGSGAATSSGTGTGVGIASGDGIGAAVSTGSATPGAIGWGTGSGAATSSGTATAYAIGWGTATNVSETLTADAVATAVWAALSASNDATGSMGEKLNDAGSASNPWTEVIDGGFTAAELLKLVSAALAGKISGAGTATVTIRDVADTTDRIVATVDSNGNRTAVTTSV